MSGQTTIQCTEILPPPVRRGNPSGLRPPWQKGQSGNPGGQNLAKYAAVRKLAASASEAAMQRLIDLVALSDDHRVVFMAAMAVIERGCGKVRDHKDEDDVASRVDISALSGEDRAKLAELLRKALQL